MRHKTFQRPGNEQARDLIHKDLYEMIEAEAALCCTTFPNDYDRLRLIVAEECDNILRHGIPPAQLRVEISISANGKAEVEISHDGPPFDSVNRDEPIAVIKGAVTRLGATYALGTNVTFTDAARTKIRISGNFTN